MIDTDKYEGHTPADQWTTYKLGADKPYHAVRFGQRGLDLELEFGADARLIADAPLLLEHVKGLTKTLELIGKNMPYDSWMHTLIKDVIGFEKWQAKEMKKND